MVDSDLAAKHLIERQSTDQPGQLQLRLGAVNLITPSETNIEWIDLRDWDKFNEYGGYGSLLASISSGFWMYYFTNFTNLAALVASLILSGFAWTFLMKAKNVREKIRFKGKKTKTSIFSHKIEPDSSGSF